MNVYRLQRAAMLASVAACTAITPAVNGTSAAQSAEITTKGNSVATLTVSIRAQGQPLAGSRVEVSPDSSYATILESSWTDTLGLATFNALPFGEIFLRVRRIGYDVQRRVVSIAARNTHFVVEMKPYDPEAWRREAGRIFQEQLKAARARPRHWYCTVPPDSVHAAALAAVGLREGMRPYLGLPPDSASFVNSFRALQPEECRGIARAMDRSYGLIDDTLYVFRVGKAFWFPRLGYGILADSTGRILMGFVVPD